MATDREYWKRYPYKRRAKNAARHSVPLDREGLSRHHWSYKSKHYTDVIVLPIKEHNKVHRYLVYLDEVRQYATLDGVLLDTKEKHLNYINQFITQ